MARVLVLTRDLLFGSNVQGALTLAGNEVELVAEESQLSERLASAPAAVLIADLTDSELDGAAIVSSLREDERLGATRTLAFYSHVEVAARESAERAGFDLVVARSRMAREGAQLVAGLV
jgi:CheY-like chemotaxis protein